MGCWYSLLDSPETNIRLNNAHGSIVRQERVKRAFFAANKGADAQMKVPRLHINVHGENGNFFLSTFNDDILRCTGQVANDDALLGVV